MPEEYVQVCPKCKSKNINHLMDARTIGIGSFANEYHCEDCGYEGMFFPEIKGKSKKKMK
jgi:predicted RNA-binding Zn-ribbon protein involved in translation (DUF1610 family)